MAKKPPATKKQPNKEAFIADLPIETLVDRLADGFVIIDRTGTVREFNPAAEKIFGYTRAEVVGRRVTMLMPEPHPRRSGRSAQAEIMDPGREVRGKRKDGTVFPMDLSVGEMPGRGGRVLV